MRCYTFEKGRLTEGIVVSVDKKGSVFVLLGEGGSNSCRNRVDFYKKNPPEVFDDTLYQAFPVKVSAGNPEKIFYTLAKPNSNKENFILLKVNTYFGPEEKGEWRVISGNPKVFASSGRCRGGDNSFWEESLVSLKRGNVICLTSLNEGEWVLDFTLTDTPMVLEYQEWIRKERFIKEFLKANT